MNILVTGATGFVGSRLTASLMRDGHHVTALTRSPEKAAERTKGIEFVRWNPGQPAPIDAVANADAIVNLAGESVNGRWSDAKKARIMDSRVQGTRALADAIATAGGNKVLVSTSAVGYYGDRGDELLTESSAPGNCFLMEVTRRWEEEALAAEKSGTRVAIFRFGIVLGPEGGALGKMLPLAKFGINGPLGPGNQWWPVIHVDDVVKGIEAAITRDYTGVYNLVAPEPVRQKDFASTLGRVIGRPSILPTPAFALRLVQGEFADEILFSKRVVPERLLSSGFKFEHPNLEKGLRHLLAKEQRREDVPAHA
jgi:uncharacterized protein (TIGR01777 family)